MHAAGEDVNGHASVTNKVPAVFCLPEYDPAVELYLTVSAEDGCTNGAYRDTDWYSWPPKDLSGAREYSAGDGPQAGDSHNGHASWTSSGWCHDGPNPSRNVRTNQLLHIHVRDNDTIPPVSSTAKWGDDALSEGGEKLLPSVGVL